MSYKNVVGYTPQKGRTSRVQVGLGVEHEGQLLFGFSFPPLACAGPDFGGWEPPCSALMALNGVRAGFRV